MDELNTVDALAQLSFLVHGRLEHRAAEQELSMVQTRLLGILRDRRPGMNELAQFLGLDKSSVTGLVDRAERRGLVQRRRSATDGRAVHVELTRHGRALVTRVEKAFDADVAGLLAPLTATQRATLTQLAGRVALAEVPEPAALRPAGR